MSGRCRARRAAHWAGGAGAQRLEEGRSAPWATNREMIPTVRGSGLGAGASAEQHGDGEEPCGPFFICPPRRPGQAPSHVFRQYRRVGASSIACRADGVGPAIGGFVETDAFEAQMVAVGVAVHRVENAEGDAGKVFGGGHAVEDDRLVGRAGRRGKSPPAGRRHRPGKRGPRGRRRVLGQLPTWEKSMTMPLAASPALSMTSPDRVISMA